MTQATINGNTYSDDGTSARDMLRGGHRTWFLPMVGDVATVASVVAGQAAQTAIDAVNAADGANALKGSSTTSLTVAAGSQTLTTQAGKQFSAGNFVTISRPSSPSTMMHGVVTAYSGTSLTVEVAAFAGSGTYTEWAIALSGPQGVTGSTGAAADLTRLTKTGAYTVTAADKAKVIECSGTFTLSFQACATLGGTWATWLKNSGTGNITLDPNGSELIDGAATYTLYPGMTMLVQCDGSQLRTVTNTGSVAVRLPILSAETVGRDANSTGESMTVDMLIPTGLSAALSTAAGYHAASGLFWAVSISGESANIATSPDGVTWTLRAMPASATWRIVETSTGLLAFAAGGTATAYSNNGGVLWSSKTVLPGNAKSSGTCLAAAVGGRVAIASSSTTLYYSDNDGGTWASYTLPASITNLWSMGGLFGSFYNNGASATYSTSPTGETWTTRTFPVTGFAPAQCSDRVALYTSTGTTQYESTDNINWAENGALKSAIFRTDGGVGAYFSATFGESFTLHKPGVPVFRTAQVTDMATYGYGQSGSLSVIGTSGGKIIRVDETATDATGLFEV